MTTPLLSYAEAADQVQRYIREMLGNLDVLLRPEEAARAGIALTGVATERVPLGAAADRVLAEMLYADRDLPPFPRSTRDGFACRAAEASSNQALSLTGQVRAGESVSGTLGSGEVWEIMTGAPVPAGADAVFMVEHAERSRNSVRLTAPRRILSGENIVPRGSEASAGDMLLPPGEWLGPAQIALAAQCGYAELTVARPPRVAILSTGDELVRVEETPGPSQIRNSNSPMLAALVSAAGGEPIVLPAVADEEAALDEAIRNSLVADLLLVTGGISMGRFDLVEGALTRAGASFVFGGVAIQPGKPVVFGQLPRPNGRPLPFFALPGNPISSAVTFHLFATPLLAALGGSARSVPRFALAQLAGDWRGKPGLTRFLPAQCKFGLAAKVRVTPWQGSGDLTAFARSNCFLVVPPEAAELAEGSLVQILLV